MAGRMSFHHRANSDWSTQSMLMLCDQRDCMDGLAAQTDYWFAQASVVTTQAHWTFDAGGSNSQPIPLHWH
jgi:hypothetical protein